MVREDLSLTQKEKFMLQAKVSELKNNMKSLLQQNQQLRLDLRRGATKTVLGRGGSPGSSAGLGGRPRARRAHCAVGLHVTNTAHLPWERE